MRKVTLSQPQCSFGDFVLFNILFNVFVHLGHDALLLWILFLAVALSWIFPHIRCSTTCLRGQCLPRGWKTNHILLLFVSCKNVFHFPWNLLRLRHHATESMWWNAYCFKYFIGYDTEIPRGRWGLPTCMLLSNTTTSDTWPLLRKEPGSDMDRGDQSNIPCSRGVRLWKAEKTSERSRG